MKKEYQLSGMSCGGCVSNVKRVLLQLPEVTEAEVYLHPQRAILTMGKFMDVHELQAQLTKAGHYKIKEVALN